MKLDCIEEVVEDFRQGRAVIIIDDKDRENEGDITVAAEHITAEHISFMQLEGKGLICAALEEKHINRLRIAPQVSENRTVFGTNFTVSVDHVSVGDQGITSENRAKTVKALADESSKPEDFVSPGWIFPLGAVAGGVFNRSGQTEGSVDLAKLAGLSGAAVICEVMDSLGNMLSGEDLQSYCNKHKLKVTSVDAIKEFRLRKEVMLRRSAEARVNDLNQIGIFSEGQGFPAELFESEADLRVLVYLNEIDNKEQLVIVKGDPKDGALVRIHSECLTGDVFSSARCDCGEQLTNALSQLFKEGEGVIIYLQQEGRGIGLGNKLKAYELQDQGLDTVDANIELGFDADSRNYNSAGQILADLGIKEVRLLTNNPEKVASLEAQGITVKERVPVTASVNQHNEDYLRTKKERMGHLI